MGTQAHMANLLNRHVLFNGDLNRNFAGIRFTQDLFDDLEVAPGDQLYAESLERRTREAQSEPVIERPFLNGVDLTWPFLQTRWLETRYSDGTRYGIWYGSPDLRTTVHETVYHWLRFVTSSYPDLTREIIAERHVFLVRCQAELNDLRNQTNAFSTLLNPRSYTATRRLGKLAHGRGEQGLLVPSARDGNGVSAVIFRQTTLSLPRSRDCLTYRWNPPGNLVTVEITPGRTWLSLRVSEILKS